MLIEMHLWQSIGMAQECLDYELILEVTSCYKLHFMWKKNTNISVPDFFFPNSSKIPWHSPKFQTICFCVHENAGIFLSNLMAFL